MGWRLMFLIGVIPLIVVAIGRKWVHEPDRFLHMQEIKKAKKAGDEKEIKRLLAKYKVAVEEVGKITYSQIFKTPGYVRRQLGAIMTAWFFYASSWAATNVYIAYYVTQCMGWTSGQAATMLLVAGGIGYFFYPLGGYLGEKWGRREVLIVTAAVTPLLCALFYFIHLPVWLGGIIYFWIYQATNGTWSGAGYAYWGESFPTRIRGTVAGLLSGWFSFSVLIGTLIWTVLMTVASPSIVWWIMAVGLSAGELSTLLCKRIKPGMKLEEIAY